MPFQGMQTFVRGTVASQRSSYLNLSSLRLLLERSFARPSASLLRAGSQSASCVTAKQVFQDEPEPNILSQRVANPDMICQITIWSILLYWRDVEGITETSNVQLRLIYS